MPVIDLSGNATSGPSPDSFLITQAMCESPGLTSGRPRGSALPASPKLPVVLRAVEALAACTVVIQAPGGGTHTRAMAAGDVYDRGQVAAISGLSSDTALLGHV